jgi:hypothetical protein
MEYLCHYTKKDTARIILENMSLKFGKVCKSNDPIEIKRFGLTIDGGGDIIEEIEQEKKLNHELNSYLNNILRIIAFSIGQIKNMNGDPDDDGVEVDPVDDIIEQASLDWFYKRPPYYLPRMWAQYGENHEGVCFIFNKTELVNQVKRNLRNNFILKHGRIKYCDLLKNDVLLNMAVTHVFQEYEIDFNNIKKTVQKYLNKNFKCNYFIKDSNWKDEQEYRFLMWNKLDNNDLDDYYIPINNNLLIGVVSGINNDNTLLQLAKQKQIKNILQLRFEDHSIIVTKA